MSMTWGNPDSVSHFPSKHQSIWLKMLVVKHLWAKLSSWKKQQRPGKMFTFLPQPCMNDWLMRWVVLIVLWDRGILQISLDNWVTLSRLAVTWKRLGHWNGSHGICQISYLGLKKMQQNQCDSVYPKSLHCTCLLFPSHWRYMRSNWWAKSNRYLLSLCLSFSLRGTQILASHLLSCQVFTVVGEAEICPAIPSCVVLG